MGALLSVVVLVLMGTLFSYARGSSSNNQPIVHFDKKPAFLTVRKKDGSGETEQVSIKVLLETKCKSLFSEFNPLWWLPDGHTQTLYCVFGNFSKVDLMWYQRTLLRLSDGGTLGLDFAPADHDKKLKNDTPIVIIQHGLTGGSYEPYVRAILSRACAPVEEGGLGYRAAVINFRGCAGVPITSPLLYSAGHTDDTRLALRYIAHKYPDAPLLAIGFSLGANVITRYLAEEGEDTKIHAACALACPWNLKENNDGLLNSFTGKHIYSKGMGSNLLRLMKKHLHSLIQDPNHYVAKAADQALKLKNPTLNDFDDTFTRIAGGPAPHFPFRNADEYYIWGSSHNVVDRIRVPFLAINAADDPVVRNVPMDGGGNGLVVMELTTGGGHLGWFQAGPGYIDRWTTKPVLEWLSLMGEDVVHDPIRRGALIYTDADGFLREKGKEHLGCKEIEGSSALFDGNNGEDGVLQGL